MKAIEEDSILIAVMTKYNERSKKGQQKYGTNLDRKDIDLLGWLNHLQEELMDATLYIEKLKKEI
jgi:succinate dehydrogenase flavin-adding protein (antitoxin of CptAB toxin-antitoxin module)